MCVHHTIFILKVFSKERVRINFPTPKLAGQLIIYAKPVRPKIIKSEKGCEVRKTLAGMNILMLT